MGNKAKNNKAISRLKKQVRKLSAQVEGLATNAVKPAPAKAAAPKAAPAKPASAKAATPVRRPRPRRAPANAAPTSPASAGQQTQP